METILRLQSWIKNFKDLGTAYQLKEQFYDTWESKSKREALERYQEWRSWIPEQIEVAFRPLTTAVSNWEKEIFAYFDHPVTNAYTEAVNGLIRIMNRLGRGYSFEVIRAKILFTEGLTKQKVEGYRNMNRISSYISEDTSSYGNFDQKWDHGIDIATLIKKIEDGDF